MTSHLTDFHHAPVAGLEDEAAERWQSALAPRLRAASARRVRAAQPAYASVAGLEDEAAERWQSALAPRLRAASVRRNPLTPRWPASRTRPLSAGSPLSRRVCAPRPRGATRLQSVTVFKICRVPRPFVIACLQVGSARQFDQCAKTSGFALLGAM